MTYTGQWLTDIVTKAFFYKKIVWEAHDLTDIVTKVYFINIYDIYRSMTDWHCGQSFFFIKKIVWEALDLTDIVTKVYFINIYDIYRTLTDWHCDQSFFFLKKNCMGSPWLDWHCDQGIFNKYLWHIQVNDWLTLWPKLFFKKKLYGKPLSWLTLWPRYIL